MNEDWLAAQRVLVLEHLAEALAGASVCGIADFPRHLNVGDQAIWLGERHALAALGVRVAAACDRTNYHPGRFARAIGDRTPVLLHGGGNLGDLYPTHQALRLRILADLRGRRVVQLAQSIHFEDDAQLEAMRRAVAAHGEVTFVLRDARSVAFARRSFEATVVLAPDGAFGLGPVDRPVAASAPLVVLAREDRERGAAGPGVPAIDWLGEPADARERAVLAGHRTRLALASGRREDGRRALPRAAAPPARMLTAYDAYARWNVDRGLRMLAAGRTVVCDRLHAHILCCAMGIPHVVIGDRHGKIRAYWDTWSHTNPLARWAEGFPEALELARTGPTAA